MEKNIEPKEKKGIHEKPEVEALEPPHWSEGLTIRGLRIIKGDVKTIVNALLSGQCPLGLAIDLRSNAIPRQQVISLVTALESTHRVFSLLVDANEKLQTRITHAITLNRHFLAAQMIPFAQAYHHPHLSPIPRGMTPNLWILVFSRVSFFSNPAAQRDKKAITFTSVLSSVRAQYAIKKGVESDAHCPNFERSFPYSSGNL